MKTALFLGLPVIVALCAIAYVRLAPVDPVRWHRQITTGTRELEGTCAASVGPMDHGAHATCSPDLPPEKILARLDAIALATPWTRRIAGSPVEGRITWETRSAIWGFPDYTTAQAEARGAVSRLDIEARQRFGTKDWGVNAARLTDWLGKFDAS